MKGNVLSLLTLVFFCCLASAQVNNELLKAIEAGEEPKIKAALRNGIHPLLSYRHEDSTFMHIIKRRNFRALDLCIRNAGSHAPHLKSLAYADFAYLGDAKSICKPHDELKYEIEQKQHYRNPLFDAISSGSIETFRLLIDYGYGLEGTRNRQHIVEYASRYEPGMLAAVLKECRPNSKAYLGGTSLFYALRKSPESVALLLGFGIDANQTAGYSQTSAFHLGAAKYWRNILKLLIGAGIDLRIKDSGGRTAAEYLEATGRKDIAVAIRLAGRKNSEMP